MKKSVLFISYLFPPVGGAGVQRATKFVKYLSEFGWQPTVLTVENPSVPLFDETLVKEIPAGTEIIRARTYEPGYKAKQAVSSATVSQSQSFSIARGIKWLVRKVANSILQPDSQILWFPQARRKANQALANKKFDAIIATAPPFSSLVLGAYLARKHNVPLALDYRDEWEISNQVWENKSMGGFSGFIQMKMQNFAIRQASSIIATSQLSTESLRGNVSRLGVNRLGAQAKTHCVYNGYDAADFAGSNIQAGARRQKYRLSYVGTLWGLTSIAPVVQALLRLGQEYPDLAKSIELVVAGRRVAEQEKLLQQLETSGIELVLHDYLSHEDALNLMDDSQGLCLLLTGIGFAKRVIPAKLFEYMATRNSIFVVAPKGEVWNLLENYSGAFFSDPEDISGLTKSLAADISRFLNNEDLKVKDFDFKKYERKSLTGQLATILDEMVGADLKR